MEDQALKWWHVRWRLPLRAITPFAIVAGKITGVLCLLAAVGYGVLYLISPWLGARNLGNLDPQLSIVPVELSNKAMAPLSSSSVDYYGFKFFLPNKEIQRTFEREWATTLLFRSGGALAIQNASRSPETFALVNHDGHTERLLGQELVHSKFKLLQAAMSARPDQLKWWKFRSSENEKAELLLLAKFSALDTSFSARFSTVRPVYAIAFGQFRGFQVGSPDVSPNDTHIDVFDGADRHFELDITGQEGHGQVLTQEEINALVASIQVGTSGNASGTSPSVTTNAPVQNGSDQNSSPIRNDVPNRKDSTKQ